MEKSLFLISLNKRTQNGFTLIEMLIVVLIIGILAAIALPQYQLARDKTEFSTMMDMTKALKDANERYYMLYQQYSPDIDALDISAPYTSVTKTGTISLIYFGWGYCALTSSTYAYCHISNPICEYVLYYDKRGGQRRCDACQTGERDDRVCQAMTGKSTYDSSSGSCNVYFF